MWWDLRPVAGRVIRVGGTQIESARHQSESLSEGLSGGFAGSKENCPMPLMSPPGPCPSHPDALRRPKCNSAVRSR
jgi:hypothetical protein